MNDSTLQDDQDFTSVNDGGASCQQGNGRASHQLEGRTIYQFEERTTAHLEGRATYRLEEWATYLIEGGSIHRLEGRRARVAGGPNDASRTLRRSESSAGADRRHVDKSQHSAGLPQIRAAGC